MFLDYEQRQQKYWVFDIETNGLINYRLHLWPTRIWCAVFKNMGDGTEKVFVNDGTRDAEIKHELWGFLSELMLDPDVVLVGHNSVSYDILVLNRLCGMSLDFGRMVDTLVLSYLYNPNLLGGHSLEAYGPRVGVRKLPNDHWTEYRPMMLERCKNDVECTRRVYISLVQRLLYYGYSELSCQIEHKIRHIMDEQEAYGFWFDIEKARSFYQMLRAKEAAFGEEVHQLFPPKLVETARCKNRKKANGEYYKNILTAINKHDQYTETPEEFVFYDYVPFNIGSPKQRIERMSELGWTPTKFTKKGNPQLDEDSLLEYAESHDVPAVAAMAHYLVHTGRANMIGTWLGFASPVDHRIHGRVFSCGAQSRRMRHTQPNSANIPSAHKALYGAESRALWGVPPGMGVKLVGYDASGLENGGLCHYLNNPEASAILIRPKPNDIHTLNAKHLTEILGRQIDREYGAKTSYYAWLYGAYPPKLGTIVGGGPEDGQKVVDTFFKNVPGLKNLIHKVKSEFKHGHGRLRTIDGGSVICPSENAALNYKIQSMGGIVMKVASILTYEESKRRGYNQHKVGDIHDEGQHECDEACAEEFGKMAIENITHAGESLNLNIKLTGDYSIGNNWAETH